MSFASRVRKRRDGYSGLVVAEKLTRSLRKRRSDLVVSWIAEERAFKLEGLGRGMGLEREDLRKHLEGRGGRVL
jgi:hypothetical protein